MISVFITDKMRERAELEANRRHNFINHHFEVAHFTQLERDIIGFLGEFSSCTLFNIDWEENIRENYIIPDSGDIFRDNLIFDVKTETLPSIYLKKLLNKSIEDDGLYGRRLINANQVELLNNYDIVIFGAIDRDSQDKWYPIGYQTTEFILNNYKVTRNRPDGGEYPFPALPIKTSDLLDINNLL